MVRILVIDDDQTVRNATKIMLDASGFEAVVADSGKSGIEAIKNGSFDLVIVDLFMPDMNGLETTKALRQHNSSIPIIAVSGFMFGGQCPDMPNFGSMAAEVGATATLYKPFRPKELMQAVRTAMGQAA